MDLRYTTCLHCPHLLPLLECPQDAWGCHQGRCTNGADRCRQEASPDPWVSSGYRPRHSSPASVPPTATPTHLEPCSNSQCPSPTATLSHVPEQPPPCVRLLSVFSTYIPAVPMISNPPTLPKPVSSSRHVSLLYISTVSFIDSNLYEDVRVE